VRGRIVPYVHLRDCFGITEASPVLEQIVITKVDNRRVGFVVDTVLGQHKTVLKSLGRFYKDVEVRLGATIMGDGTVAMILNIPSCEPGRTAGGALGSGMPDPWNIDVNKNRLRWPQTLLKIPQTLSVTDYFQEGCDS